MKIKCLISKLIFKTSRQNLNFAVTSQSTKFEKNVVSEYRHNVHGLNPNSVQISYLIKLKLELNGTAINYLHTASGKKKKKKKKTKEKKQQQQQQNPPTANVRIDWILFLPRTIMFTYQKSYKK